VHYAHICGRSTPLLIIAGIAITGAFIVVYIHDSLYVE
jgi:hypothetical protein